MKYAVIDIGSNSVRLLINEDGVSLFKKVEITKLAKDMQDGMLDYRAIERTSQAVACFFNYAKQLFVDKIYCFATAATRKAKNRQILLDKIKELCNLEVDVISGDKEAFYGAYGALNGLDGGVIDIGGASSEIAVINKNKMVYSHSLSVGAVTLTDHYLQSKEQAGDFLAQKLKEYGRVNCKKFYAIGGTATSISAILQKLEVYDASKVHGYVIDKGELYDLVDKLFDMPVEDRRLLKGLQPQRAEIIAQGGLILLSIMNYLDIEKVIVSENDNLEGYLMEKIKNE